MSQETRILYMEDNEGTARLLQKRLSRAGYTVDIAATGGQGLALTAANAYDVILVDYKMPGLNGLQVIQRLLEQGQLPAIIMLTGTGDEHIAVEALKLGATDYVVKDVEAVYLDLLPSIIEQGLKNRQLLEDKRRAEEALKRSEQYYRSLIENSLDLILLTDAAGNIRYVSPSIRSLFGMDEQSLIGQNGLEFLASGGSRPLDSHTYTSIQCFFQALLHAPDKLIEAELQVFINGAALWLEVRGRNLLHQPWIAAVVFNIRLITERKQAEAALRESEERFRQLFELAPDPYAITDTDGNLIDCNRAAAEIMRTDREHLIGKPVIEIGSFLPVEYNSLVQAFKASVANHAYFQVEVSIRRFDGTQFIADIRVEPVTIKGEPRILGIVRDITWHKQAEAQMVANLYQLQTLSKIDSKLTRKLDIDYVIDMALETIMGVSGADAGSIHVIDQDLVVQSRSIGYPADIPAPLEQRLVASRAAQQKEPEWVTNAAADPTHTAVLPDTASQITIPLLSQDRLVGVLHIETRQADRFSEDIFEFLKLIASRVSVAIDNARLYHTTQEQLAELQTLYTQLTQLEQLKTDMIRVASHDLRNPLAVVSLDVYVLRRLLGDQLSAQEKKHLEQIENAAKQMQSIARDFLSLDRLDAATSGDVPQHMTNLSDVVKDTFAYFHAQAEQRKQIYRLRLPESSVFVQASRPELQRAVANLIGNAIKYTPSGGSIDVALRQDAQGVQFEVIDSGYGIPAEQQAKLFQPFFRAQTEETAAIEGSGLGPHLVKRLIERMGGTISFRSTYGKGSTFGFTLPPL
ncbi:MAG: PAS domain S-box protein [Anaerolineae bacterium]|nr:PAS domain S-box protein [Anaerolineae bacterium]